VSSVVTSARRSWAEGQRRLNAADPAQQAALHAQVDAVVDELNRRVGQTFTLEELAAAYGSAERWVRDVVEERAATPGWPRTLAIVEDAAFHRYARGAVDYEP
jgi:hypothetical protein